MTIIVCCVSGDNESGKTTLIAKLQGNEDPKKGSGLEYAYIDVRDEYRDGECRRMGTWAHTHARTHITRNNEGARRNA